MRRLLGELRSNPSVKSDAECRRGLVARTCFICTPVWGWKYICVIYMSRVKYIWDIWVSLIISYYIFFLIIGNNCHTIVNDKKIASPQVWMNVIKLRQHFGLQASYIHVFFNQQYFLGKRLGYDLNYTYVHIKVVFDFLKKHAYIPQWSFKVVIRL